MRAPLRIEKVEIRNNRLKPKVDVDYSKRSKNLVDNLQGTSVRFLGSGSHYQTIKASASLQTASHRFALDYSIHQMSTAPILDAIMHM